MSMAAHSAPTDIELDAGESHPLDDRETGFLIRSGRVEVYASLLADGEPVSGRHFLFELKAEDLIPPLMTAVDGLTLFAVATEPAAMFPVARSFILGMAGAKERAAVLAEQIDRWIAAVAGALGRILGPNPSGTIAEAAGGKFQLGGGVSVTLRSGAGWCFS